LSGKGFDRGDLHQSPYTRSSLDLALEVFNLGNRKNNDISYFYTSRVAGEPLGGVPGLHVHPAELRSLRLTARLRF
jgi:hypothetical protein